MDLPPRLARFAADPEGEVGTAEALLWVAACRPEGADPVTDSLHALEELAATVPDATGAAVCATVAEAGFRGDDEDYHHPRNSFLDVVMRRRRGIPITLAVVMIEVARRRGVAFEPIGAPAHFLIRDPATDTYRDPFAAGRTLSTAEVEAAARRVLPPGSDVAPFLRPVGRVAVVSRVLNNLQQSYGARDPRGLDWVLALRLALPESFHGDPITLARLCERRGRYLDAAAMYRVLGERRGDPRLVERGDALLARSN